MPKRFRNLTRAQEEAFERIATGQPGKIRWPTLRCLLQSRTVCVNDDPSADSPLLAVPDSVLAEYRSWCAEQLGAEDA